MQSESILVLLSITFEYQCEMAAPACLISEYFANRSCWESLPRPSPSRLTLSNSEAPLKKTIGNSKLQEWGYLRVRLFTNIPLKQAYTNQHTSEYSRAMNTRTSQGRMNVMLSKSQSEVQYYRNPQSAVLV
ncbi:uncharacterized protein [Physcomitrium patens]|uniref:uncharacterized protein n=1 Tax=Physcomitrium patens TaxID=3218 RepID=UPI000D166782|nr:uncharacterized protein LOC112285150 isoform X1 [Physcomitrium patens]|eukprot:XP_024381495.1 uncharacterized protein LOC112285150 isoform X1 [Physcomitrella patens]